MSPLSNKLKVAIIGSGNIGTDLMIKVIRTSNVLEMGPLVGIDPNSEGLALANSLGIVTTTEGLPGLTALPVWEEIDIVFDATSAATHSLHAEKCRVAGKIVVDLTPAAVGPYVVPEVNGDAHLDSSNVNMVTCGGQATIPIVAAVSAVAKVHYAEIVSSIASKSAGPGTRANIDEFTQTTAGGIESGHGLRSPTGLGTAPTNGDDAGLVFGVVDCSADGVDEALVSVGSEVDNDVGSRGDTCSDFDVEHDLTVSAVGVGRSVLGSVDQDG